VIIRQCQICLRDSVVVLVQISDWDGSRSCLLRRSGVVCLRNQGGPPDFRHGCRGSAKLADLERPFLDLFRQLDAADDHYVAAWTGSLQQSLPLRLIAALSYLGNKGTDVLTTTYTNLAIPSTNVVPHPAFGVVSCRGDVGNSTFEALQFNLRRAFHNGLLVSSNYMWSHSINDGSIGGGDSDEPQNSFCRSCDKASSDFDVRHLFNLSAVYALRLGAGKRYLSSP
jgi:hypothetical protein